MAKSYKEKFRDEDGVWRTIGGRRVFIKTGQSLSQAMRDSGKFKRMKEEKEHYREMDEKVRKVGEQFEKQYQDEMVEARRLGREDLEELAKEKRKENMRNVGEARLSIKKDWEERLAGKEYISDYPEAYRHYERDSETVYNLRDEIKDEFGVELEYPTEEDYMPGGKRWNKEWASSREGKISQEGIERIKSIKNEEKTGNDYLPKASKIMTAGTSNRKEVSDNIQAHILEYYDNPVDFMEQMDNMDYLPTRWKAGEELAKGGSYLIYNGDMADYLNSLNINPKGKTFSEDKSFEMYTSLIGRESERLYNRLEKLYEQYKKEHKGSNVSLDDFRKWFK